MMFPSKFSKREVGKSAKNVDLNKLPWTLQG